jgi:hypothetical protein
VTGAFAAIRSVCPHASIARILTALQKTGILIADTRTGGTQMKPRIRVDKAVGFMSNQGNNDCQGANANANAVQ